MGRFGVNTDKESLKYNEESSTNDFFNKVLIKEEIEQRKVVNQELETDNVDHLYKQTEEQKEKIDSNDKAKSLFSNNHSINKTAEKKYISPFNTNEYTETSNKSSSKNKEETEDEDPLSKSRFTFYGFIIIFVYLICLGIGYHNTIFSEGVPQIVSLEDRKKQVYLAKADEYITTLQNIHAEIILATDNYSNNVIADAELNRSMTTFREKIVKTQEELQEIVPPDSSQHFQSQLNELYSLQLTFCDNVIAYLKNKNNSTLSSTKTANENYEDKISSFLQEYNSMFIKI